MKNFLTSMLGALAALVIFTCGAALLFVGFVGVIAAMGNKQKVETVEKGSYLVFDLEANITDAPPVVDFALFTGGRIETLQLRTATRAIRAAAKDDRIAGVLLKGSLSPAGYGTGFAALREVREALLAFKASGKPVKAYLTFAQTKDYYLASVADEIILDPYGVILMPGLASEPMFLAGTFEKYGIGVQVTRVGKYKSAVEPYTRKEMSPESREQLQKLLDDIWGNVVGDIAASRHLKAGDVQAVVDAEGLIRPEAAKASKLIDRVAYRDEVIDQLKALTGRKGSRDSFKQISLQSYARSSGGTGGSHGLSLGRRNTIAVLYAEGAIVDGEGELRDVGGDKFSREIRRLRQDSSVKAIVLRVNSPGGSVSASETIQREVRLAQKVKPVIVSMGTYAASGGYWISAYADRIFAEPSTVTGSIGVFGVQFDVKKLANDFGVTFDSVTTGKFAGSLTITRPKTDEELAVLQRMVDWVYEQFTAKVAEGRRLKLDFVREIAEGRVWSGSEAKKLGLVDEIGDLDAAIKYAADRAKVGSDYRLEEFPRKKELAEALAEAFEKMNPGAGSGAKTLAGRVSARLTEELKSLETFNDPQGLYARLPLDLRLR